MALSSTFLDGYVHFVFGEERPDIDRYLFELADLGVRRVFLRAPELSELKPGAPASAARVGKVLRETGVGAHTVHALYGGPTMLGYVGDDGRAEALRRHEETLRIAADLGADNVVFHLEAAYSEASAAAARAALDRLLPLAADARVLVALEVLSPGCYGSRVEHLRDLLEHYASPWLGICLDFGHSNQAGTLAEWIDAMAGHVVTLHLHDNDGVRDQHLPPGLGTADWAAGLECLRRAGYAGPLVSEARTPAGWDAARLVAQFEAVCGPWAAPPTRGLVA